MRRLLVSAAALALLSCAPSRPYSLAEFLEESGALPAWELKGVPFFPQTRHQCGPAALATVLVHAGVDTTPEKLEPQVFLPGRKGSLAVELVAASRRHGRLPYPVAPELKDVLVEVRAGNPVLVLLNLGTSGFPLWHFAVVVGYDASEEVLLLRSGKDRWKVTAASRFHSAWRRADFWAIVVVPPHRIPASADRDVYLGEAAALEETGRLDEAEEAYRAALQRWPENEAALLGLGNARYARGDLHGAAASFVRLVRNRSDSAAGFNNLAHVLGELRCYPEALDAARRALALIPQGEGIGLAAAETEREILRKMREEEAAVPCPVPGVR